MKMLLSPFRSLAPLHRGLARRYAQCGLPRSLATGSHNTPVTSTSGEPAHHHEEPKGLYNMPQHLAHHGDPRKYLNPDGTYQYPITPQVFHYEDPYSNVPKQHIVSVGGKKMIKGIETRPLVELFTIHQVKSCIGTLSRLSGFFT